MQLLAIIKIISQIKKYKWYKVLHFVDDNSYECYDYKHVKICIRENEWEWSEVIIETRFWLWDYRFLFLQISRSVLNSISYLKKFFFYFALADVVQWIERWPAN